MEVRRAKVRAVRRLPAPELTYNLSVDGTRNYFANGVLTHNCDDPHPVNKAESEADRGHVVLWWNESIPTRLNEPDRGVKMVIQQRVHRADLAGDCIAKGYHAVVLPMRYEHDHPQLHPRDPRKKDGELLHPARIDETAARVLETALGPYAAAGQLMQRPAPREGGLFKREWFKVIDRDQVPLECAHNKRRGWDLAATVLETGKDPDWTVGVLTSQDHQGRVYIEDRVRLRDSPGQVDAAILATATRDGYGVTISLPQDPGQAGKAQVAAMVKMLAGYPVIHSTETGDKGTRARPFSTYAQAGNVYLVRGSWNEEFLDELADFPNGAHDDQLDATVRSFTALVGGNTGVLEWMRQQALDAAVAAGMPADNVQVIKTHLGWPAQ